jgi:predicted nucleic acid-binding Zn ribbon protein
VSRPRPVRVGDVLAGLLRESGLAERVAEAAVVPEWAERVGPAIAAVTEPLRASRGTLIVAVRSSAWLMELRLMERQILERLNTGRSQGRVQRVRFVMAGGGSTGSRGDART